MYELSHRRVNYLSCMIVYTNLPLAKCLY